MSDPCRSSVPVCRNSSPKSSDVNVGLMFKFPSSTNELLRLLAYHWNSPSYSTHNTFFSNIRQTDSTELIPGRRWGWYHVAIRPNRSCQRFLRISDHRSRLFSHSSVFSRHLSLRLWQFSRISCWPHRQQPQPPARREKIDWKIFSPFCVNFHSLVRSSFIFSPLSSVTSEASEAFDLSDGYTAALWCSERVYQCFYTISLPAEKNALLRYWNLLCSDDDKSRRRVFGCDSINTTRKMICDVIDFSHFNKDTSRVNNVFSWSDNFR